jgi:CTP synthase (UTP-ammonia lyase)
MHPTTRVALIGDFSDQHKAHKAIPTALAGAPGGGAEGVWISTDAIPGPEALAEFQGVWCVPGMPYRNPDGVIKAIRYARMSRTPFLGTSAGFQYAILEFARHVLGLSEADHQKSNPKAAVPLIGPLGVAMAGVKARVRFSRGSMLNRAYGRHESVEEYRCSFGVNGRYRRLLEGRDLLVTAVDDQDEIRAVELDGHPFYVATLFQPELRSLESNAPNPVVDAFVGVCQRHGQKVSMAS